MNGDNQHAIQLNEAIAKVDPRVAKDREERQLEADTLEMMEAAALAQKKPTAWSRFKSLFKRRRG